MSLFRFVLGNENTPVALHFVPSLENRGPTVRQFFQLTAEMPHDLLMATAPGYRDDGTESVVVFCDELQEMLALSPGYGFDRTGQRTPESVARPHRFGQKFL